MKIAIQGNKSYYQHQVARYLYKDAEVVECMNFEIIVDAPYKAQVYCSIMAIGNPNPVRIRSDYALIETQNLFSRTNSMVTNFRNL